MGPAEWPCGISCCRIPLAADSHCRPPSPRRPDLAKPVAVVDRPGQHIGNCLYAAMRVPRESGPVIVGAIVAEIVQQKKRIEFSSVAEAEGPPQFDAGALDDGLGLNDSLHGPDGHGTRSLPLA